MDRSEIRKLILDVAPPNGAEELIDFFTDAYVGSGHGLQLPSRDETAAATLTKHKTAALCFDRVWSPIPDDRVVPEPIRFIGHTHADVTLFIMAGILTMMKKHATDKGQALEVDGDLLFDTCLGALRSRREDYRDRPNTQRNEMILRDVCEGYHAKYGVCASPVYASLSGRDTEFVPGPNEAIMATLSNLEVVDDSTLTWEQVLEFREDDEAKSMYRRLVYWVSNDMEGKSQSQIQDFISFRIEDHRAALKKHGIKTLLGTVATTVSAICVPTLLNIVNAQPAWAMFA